ncbi:hypothetical protein PCS70012_02340, partial [Streptococcus pneumoniae PCS70012]
RGFTSVPRGGHTVLVLEDVGEDPQPHPDLRRRQTHAVGRVHGLMHVRHELAQGVVEVGHPGRGAMQHGVTGDHNGTDGHAESTSGFTGGRHMWAWSLDPRRAAARRAGGRRTIYRVPDHQ